MMECLVTSSRQKSLIGLQKIERPSRSLTLLTQTNPLAVTPTEIPTIPFPERNRGSVSVPWEQNADTGAPVGSVTIGEGSDISTGTLFTYNDSQPIRVNGVGFTASNVAIAKWTFTPDLGTREQT